MKLSTLQTTLIACCCSLILAACKKDKTGSRKINIEGFSWNDPSGVGFGHYGPEDKDWTFDNTLTEEELKLFDFEAGIDLDNTVETAFPGKVTVYPNPADNNQSYHFSPQDSVLMKLVLVNDKLELLMRAALKIKGTTTIGVLLSDQPDIFKNKTAFRVYYSFSATGKPNFKTGYGDAKVCRGVNNVANCF